MAITGPSTNHSSNPAAAAASGGGVSSPWNQIVAAAAPTSLTFTAVESAPAEEHGEGFDDAGINGGGGGGGGAGKKHAWNKPSSSSSNGGGSSSTSMKTSEEVVKPVMDDADSWPALSDSARASAAKPPSQSEPPAKASVTESQVTGSILPPPQRQIRDNAGMNNVVQTHQRPFKRNNSNMSSNGGHPTHMSGPQGSMAGSGSHSHNSRTGFGPNEHHPQRNSYRNRNGGPHPRGDGPHHHNYGGRRDQGHGNQEWNTHRNYNGRENYMQPRYGGPRFMRSQPPPPPPNPPHLYPPPPPIRPPFGGMAFSELPPPQMVYVPPPPLDSLRGYPFVPPIPPNLMFFQPPDPHLHTKIVNQIDYYFSDNNLIKDLYLRQHMDDQGWVPISLIAGFKKVTQLTDNIQIVLDAVRTLSTVEVQGDKIRRRNDWGRWLIPRVQHPNATSSQAVGQLTEQFKGTTLEATNQDGARGLDVSQNGELNSQSSLSTSESTDQVGMQDSDRSKSARN